MLKKSLLSQLNTVYICLMIVYMAIREVLPLNFLISSTAVSAAVFAVGAVLIAADLLTKRKCISGRMQDLLILFLAVCCVSSIINMKLGIFDNIKFIATLALQYFIFFCFTKGDSREETEKKLNAVSLTVIIVWAAVVLFCILAYFFTIDIIVFDKGSWGITNQGFSTEYARLWGVLQDPNYAGGTSIFSVFASVRFILISKKLHTRILNGLNILLQTAYIILGGSRATLLLLIAAIAVFCTYRFLFSTEKKSAAEIIRGFGKTAVSAVLAVALIFSVKAGLPYLKAYVFAPLDTNGTVASVYSALYKASDFEFTITYSDNQTSLEGSDDGETIPTIDSIDRTDLNKGDISNGRFTRWQHTVEVFLNAPLFGTSPRNLAAFAKIHNPDTLLAQYSIAPHNGYLDVLAETGLAGFAVLGSAVLLAVITILRRFFREKFTPTRALMLVTIIVLAGIAVFISDIYLLFSMNSLLFWLLLGMAYHYDTEIKANGIFNTVYSKTIGRITDRLFAKKG